jgi:transcriptional regulator with XRE-family HTH domain
MPDSRPDYRTLRDYRRARKLSQRAIAAEFGISQAHWCRLEAGTRCPRPRFAARLAKASGIPLSRLLGLGRVAVGILMAWGT